MASIGEADYRNGAKERLEEAFILLQRERFGGSIYLAGRVVEGMLRAVIWKSDTEYRTGKKSLETGHDLRALLLQVGNLGVLSTQPGRDRIRAAVERVARLWSNDMRYLPTTKIQARWYTAIGGKRSLKQAAGEYYDACSDIVKGCEKLWIIKKN